MKRFGADHEGRSNAGTGRSTRPLTIVLLILLLLTWHFAPEIQAFFRGFVFGG